jgi:hypothetical protein
VQLLLLYRTERKLNNNRENTEGDTTIVILHVVGKDVQMKEYNLDNLVN